MDKHAVVMADRQGVIVHWSAGAEASFGYKASDALGQSLNLIVPETLRADHWKGFRRAMESGEASTDGQEVAVPVQRANGEPKAFRGLLTLVRDIKREVIGVMVVFDPSQD
jgi:PAS domain S-box-containing protein